MFRRYLQLCLFRISYLVFPFLIGDLILIWQKPTQWLWYVLLVLAILFIYSRFIETQKIVINQKYFSFLKGENHPGLEQKKIKFLRVAIMADLHLGVYKNVEFLKRVVDEVNKLEPDLVLLPGDVIYDPSREEICGTLFAGLERLRVRTLAVTGNHDAQIPGYIEVEKVRVALSKYQVEVIDNKVTEFKFQGRNLKIIGLSDLLEERYDLNILKNMAGEENCLILAHNPDFAYAIDQKLMTKRPVLMVTGHTHAGQIRIPWLYKKVIPCDHDFDWGWYDIGNLKVLVSGGLGEVLLPLRLGRPPEIILLNLQLN